MANELSVAFSLTFTKGTAPGVGTVTRASGTSLITVSGSKYYAGVQNIGTSEETVDKGDVGTIGYAMFHNLDGTNFIELGSSTGVYAIKLKPGEWAMCRWDGTNVLALADTGACNLEYYMIED